MANPVEKSRKFTFIFVIGGPGVGKGSQCSRAAAALGAAHLSAGELLRAEVAKPESPYRKDIENCFRESIPVNHKLINTLLHDAIHKQPHKLILVDAFPLTKEQLDGFEALISKEYSTIYLKANLETLEARLKERAKSSDRVDDQQDNISRRIKAFSTGLQKMIVILQNNGLPFLEIDAEVSLEQVQADFRKALEELVGGQDAM